MKNIRLAFTVLILAASFADARGGRGFAGGGRGSSRGASRSSFGGASRTSSISARASVSRSRAIFGSATRRSLTGTSAPSGGSTGTGSTGTGGSGSSTGSSAPPAWATPGALIRTAGQMPVYSNPGNGGTTSVQGGGFIAQDASKSQGVNAGPGVTWGAPDRTPSSGSGAGGNGATSNGPAFDPSF